MTTVLAGPPRWRVGLTLARRASEDGWGRLVLAASPRPRIHVRRVADAETEFERLARPARPWRDAQQRQQPARLHAQRVRAQNNLLVEERLEVHAEPVERPVVGDGPFVADGPGDVPGGDRLQ